MRIAVGAGTLDDQGWSWACEIDSHSAAETRGLARSLGRGALEALDCLVVLLCGPLGAGKTLFAQGLLEGLGIGGRVSSPTFTLINEYAGRLPAWHVDLYRLDDEAEFAAIGGDELLLGGRGVVVVEWADKLCELVPREYVRVTLSFASQGAGPGDERKVLIEVVGSSLKPAADAVRVWVEASRGRGRC